MASTDRPDDPEADAKKPPSLEMGERLGLLSRAIDDVLVANHTLRHSLAPGHVPLNAPIGDAAARYRDADGNPTPVFGLWVECRAVEALRVAWTGKPSVVPAPIVVASETDTTIPMTDQTAISSEEAPKP